MASCSSRALLAPAAREARDSPRRALAVTVLNTRSLLLSAVLAAASLSSASAWSPTAHGALVAVAPPSGAAYNVELAVEGLASFRVSVVNDSSVLPAQIATPMVVDKTAYAIYTVSQAGTVVNLTAPGVGSVSLDAASGAFALADASGRVLTSAPTLLSASASPPDVRRDTCANPQVDSDAANPQRSKNYPNGATVTDQTVCCERCNNDPACTAWVYDTQADSPNCWPLSDAGGRSPNVPNRVLGAPPPPPALAFNFTTSPAATFVGAGTDGPSAKTLIRTGTVQAGVANTASWTPSFHCSDGWSLLAASPRVDAGDGVHGTGVYGVSWTRGPPAVGGVTVHVTGASADLYLTPAADLRAHVTTQAALEGTAAVLPRYSYAFYACRWGWVNQTYIEGVLARFRALQAPLDTMISDFVSLPRFRRTLLGCCYPARAALFPTLFVPLLPPPPLLPLSFPSPLSLLSSPTPSSTTGVVHPEARLQPPSRGQRDVRGL